MDREHESFDPAFFRGLTQPRLSRRQLLRHAGVGAGSLALTSFLAACGSNAQVKPRSTGFDWSEQEKTGELTFGNWPLYIDKDPQQVLIGEGESSVAKNPLVFPTRDTYDRLHGYQILDSQETQLREDTFLPVYQS